MNRRLIKYAHVFFADIFRKEKDEFGVKITIIAVGKIKEKYLRLGIDEYRKRLGRYTKLEIIEVADEKAPENLSPVEMEMVKQKEGERILAQITPDDYVMTLEISGKMCDSLAFAKKIENLATYGNSKIVFVIGGSLGISKEVQKRSNEALSFSKMTFPHQLMRLILLEQIYRAFRIINNEPYHK